MKNNQHILILLLFCGFLLFSCRSPADIETEIRQEQPLPSATKFEFPATWTPISTATITSPPPSVTPFQILSKPELISYTFLGADGVSPEMSCLIGYDYEFKLYDDGQLLFFESSIVWESYLTETEVQDLMTQIEQTGFLDLEGTGELREEDPIYENAPDNVETGAAGLILKVKDKRIETDWVLKDYLVEPINQTFEIISSYRPEESHIYSPDQIFLWIFPIEDSESINWSQATPIPPIQEWPESITSLDALMMSTGDYFAFIGGVDANVIYEIHGFFPSSKVYTQNGQEYYVVACPIEP
jgi:hypothetical protein